jgi:hypothetical protein
MIAGRKPIAFRAVALAIREHEVVAQVYRIPSPCDEVIDVGRRWRKPCVTVKAQQFLDTSQAQLADDPETRTKKYGLCPARQYCLGYNSLFHPLKPRLTDFLLTRKPPKTTNDMVSPSRRQRT